MKSTFLFRLFVGLGAVLLSCGAWGWTLREEAGFLPEVGMDKAYHLHSQSIVLHPA